MNCVTTWMAELLVVASALAGVVILTHGGWVEWLGAGAVGLSFAHGQVADRLAEREATREHVVVECHRMATRYFVAKEACWLVYFIAHRSYAALAGVVLFLVYPLWRRTWRCIKPLQRTAQAKPNP